MTDSAKAVNSLSETDFEYNLATIDSFRRASTWQSWNAQLFQDALIRSPRKEISHGYIQGVAFGSGRLFRIGSTDTNVSRRQTCHMQAPITLVLQLSGQSIVQQSYRECHLKGNDFTFLDGNIPFYQDMTERPEIILVQLPRSLVVSRHPCISDITVQRFDGQKPETGMIWNFVTGMVETIGRVESTARSSILLSLIELIGAVVPDNELSTVSSKGHVHRALTLIENEFYRPEFNATCLAAELGVSRRRLDELFVEVVGRSLSAHIWERRLVRAAIELRASSKKTSTVTQIALSMGFEDSAHFSRAFKKRFKLSPTEWRTAGSEAMLSAG